MSYPDSAVQAGPGRVVIISASVGAGHDGAAAELARGLTGHGVAVDRHDFLDLLPARLGPLVSGGYHQLLNHAPWGYQRVYAATERPRGRRPLAGPVLRATEGRTLRVLPPDTRAVVSTYPLASQVLGALRRSGRLGVPALTYLTDFSVHPMWVAPGVDTHLAAHAVPAGQATACGAAGVLASGPLVHPRFGPATAAERRAARARFGLPAEARLALMVAGSWGVGPVERAAAAVRDRGGLVPVVVCGRNRALADRLRAAGIEHAFGWVGDMPELMHAADVLVQNAGGLTSLEAFASGLPVASYGCIPGHGRANAAALEAAGLAKWIRREEELAPVLGELLDGPLGLAQRAAGLALFATGADRGPVAAVLDAMRSAAPRPGTPGCPPRARALPGRRRTAAVVVAALATTLLAGPESAEGVARGGADVLRALRR